MLVAVVAAVLVAWCVVAVWVGGWWLRARSLSFVVHSCCFPAGAGKHHMPPTSIPSVTTLLKSLLSSDLLKTAVAGATISLALQADYSFSSFATDQNIFVRPCYKPLFDLIDKGGANDIFLIKGSPGVGKTVFGWLLVATYVKEGKTVVHETSGGVPLLLTPGGGVTEWGGSLSGKPDIYVADLVPSHPVYSTEFYRGKEHTVLIGSAGCVNSSVHNQICKVANQQKIMPPFAQEEMEHLVKAAFPGKLVSADKAKAAFLVWGGCARRCVGNYNETLTAVIQSVPRGDLMEMVKNVGTVAVSSSKYVHEIFHPVCDPASFDIVSSKFASDAMADGVLDHLRAGCDSYLADLLAEYDGVGDAGGLLGHLYERYVHRVFKIREVHDGAVAAAGAAAPWQLRFLDNPPAAPVTHWSPFLATDGEAPSFYDLKELKPDSLRAAPRATYYQPRKKNFETADSFYFAEINDEKALVLASITVSSSHSRKTAGLKSVVDKALELFPSWVERVYLIFVVPPKVFTTFKPENWLSSEGNSVILKQYSHLPISVGVITIPYA